ncbi:MAG TPA: SIS domain-containing protein [Anaerolineales bacterium]|nr:SIS domain-containing protein [Anaerolineales bacterium]
MRPFAKEEGVDELDSVAQYLEEVQAVLAALPLAAIRDVADVLLSASYVGSTIFTLGNGGSAATASHFACDLAKGTIRPGRPRFRVIALTDNVPLMTAWSNDVAYEDLFAEQLRNLIRRGDVVVAFSGSGNSPNVLSAMDLAHRMGGITIGFSGFAGGRLSEVVDVPVVVPSFCIEQIEDVHLVLCHLTATVLRERLERIEPPVALMLDLETRAVVSRPPAEETEEGDGSNGRRG